MHHYLPMVLGIVIEGDAGLLDLLQLLGIEVQRLDLEARIAVRTCRTWGIVRACRFVEKEHKNGSTDKAQGASDDKILH